VGFQGVIPSASIGCRGTSVLQQDASAGAKIELQCRRPDSVGNARENQAKGSLLQKRTVTSWEALAEWLPREHPGGLGQE